MASWKQRKYSPPPLPEPFVRREALLHAITDAADSNKRLTIIQAGSGYGKSTLVADYLQTTQAQFAWVTLDASDQDPFAFFDHLIGAIALRFSGFQSRSLELLRSVPNPQSVLPNATGILADELASLSEESSLMIVLDDFHEVDPAAPVQTIVENLIQYLPDNIHLILTTRFPLQLRLAQLRVRQQILELTADRLRFGPEDVESLLRSFHWRPLAPQEVEKVCAQTEGWVASLILIGYAMQSTGKEWPVDRLLDQASGAIYDYLAQEVFESQPPDIQQFLLESSLLPYLEPQLCDIVLKRRDSQALLNRLSTRPVFLSRLSGEAFAYQLHPLYQLFLSDRLNREGDRAQITQIYRQLGDFCRHQHQDEEAIAYYLEAQEPSSAEDALRQIADRYLQFNRWEAILALLERFPEAYRDASPWWHLYRGEVFRWVGDYDKALWHYAQTQELARGVDEAAYGRSLAFEGALSGSRGDDRQQDLLQQALEHLPGDDYTGRAFALNALASAYLMINDSDRAIAHYEQALALYQQNDDPVGQSKVLHNLGLTYARFGRFDQAQLTYRESIRQAEAAGKLGHAMTYNNLAIISIYQGDIETAWKEAEKAYDIAKKIHSKREEVFVLWTLGYAAVAVKDFQRAQAHFEQCREQAIALGDRANEAGALDGLAEVARLQGKFARGFELLDQAIALREVPLKHPAMLDQAMSYALLCLESHRFDQAAELLSELYEATRQRGYRYRQCRLAFHLARLATLQHDTEKRAEYLGEALQLAEANQYQYLLLQEMAHLEDEPQAPQPTLLPKPAIAITAFGTFEVEVEGVAIPQRDWRGFKTKLILACLLQQRQGVTKEQLTDLLYGEAETSRTAVLVLISRLRQALEPQLEKAVDSRFIQFREGRYFFNRGLHYELDTERFESWVRQANDPELSRQEQTEAWMRAIALYRGEYLAEFSSEAWLQTDQAYFRRLAQETFHNLFDYLMDDERYNEAIELADRCLSIEPYSERAYQTKIEALAEKGMREEALRHYRELTTMLSDQFGLKPDRETERLHQKFLS